MKRIVFIIIDWANSDTFGVFTSRKKAEKSMKEDGMSENDFAIIKENLF